MILILPYTADTHHYIGARELGLMKRSAVLINMARGGIVDDAALIEALRERRICGAGLDVYENEPTLEPRFARVEERRSVAAHRQRVRTDPASDGNDCGGQLRGRTDYRKPTESVEP